MIIDHPYLPIIAEETQGGKEKKGEKREKKKKYEEGADIGDG